LRTALPLVTVAAFHDSVTDVLDALTLNEEGAAGLFPAVTAEITADVAEVPIAFTALTLKQYFVPAFRPVRLKVNFAEAVFFIVV
jgi:hypothetical protein